MKREKYFTNVHMHIHTLITPKKVTIKLEGSYTLKFDIHPPNLNYVQNNTLILNSPAVSTL